METMFPQCLPQYQNVDSNGQLYLCRDIFSRRLARLSLESLCMEAECLGASVRDTLDEGVTHVLTFRDKGQCLDKSDVQRRYAAAMSFYISLVTLLSKLCIEQGRSHLDINTGSFRMCSTASGGRTSKT